MFFASSHSRPAYSTIGCFSIAADEAGGPPPPPPPHTGGRDDEDRPPPGERRVTVAIEVNDVRSKRALQREEPLARSSDVLPRIIHPLQPAGALEHRDAAPFRLQTLRFRRRWPHHRDG